MSADLCIHVKTDWITEDVWKMFLKECPDDLFNTPDEYFEEQDGALEIIRETPQCWVGQVSWLKAALLDDEESYVPSPVGRISELIPYWTTVRVTEELIEQVDKAFDLVNSTSYDVVERKKIIAFLRENFDKEVFTISW